jgi:hypothetical protein
MSSFVAYQPELKLMLLPAMVNALQSIAAFAKAQSYQLYVNPEPSPHGLEVTLGTVEQPPVSANDHEYTVCHLDYSTQTQMFLVRDDTGVIHRVSSARAVSGMLW